MNTRKVTDLRPHTDSAAIYLDGPNDEMIRGLREKGVIKPFLITYDNRIIDGRRQWLAINEAALPIDEVPVHVFPSKDELDIEEAILTANDHRVKTNEQRAREA